MLAEKEIFTMKEAAAFASVSEMTIRRWIADKKLPTSRPRGVKRGSRVLIRRADLLSLIPAKLAAYEAKPEPKDGDK